MLRLTRCLIVLRAFLFFSVPCFSADPMVFDLTWQASGSGCSINVESDLQESFAKELDFGNREVVRGLLPCADSKEHHIAFIWDFEEKRLYIDGNRNRDLTDDPNSIYQSKDPNIEYQSFRDVEIEISRESLAYRYRFSINFNRYNLGRIYISLSVRSGFQAKIDLAGQTWHVQYADNLDGKIGGGDTFHIRPRLGGRPNLPNARLSNPRSLFLNGHLYDCTYAFVADGNQPKVQLTLAERKVPLGQLTIAGKDIKYLELHSQYIVPIFEPNQAGMPAPVGNYTCQALELHQQGPSQLYVEGLNKRVGIHEGELSMLALGGPIKSTVTVNRVCKSLVLNYKLIGQGGEEYRNQGRGGSEPTFTVFHGDKEIYSGKFEYG